MSTRFVPSTRSRVRSRRLAARARGVGSVVALVALPAPIAAQVDPGLAEAYFEEAKALCEREGGRLWGVSLCGPMVFADAATETIATNRPPPKGERPSFLGYANAAAEWDGTRWATFVWSYLPREDRRARGGLMLHELFHRIQPELGLLLPEPKNDHLDTAEGRYWLQLEWRALARALAGSGPARDAAIRDALAFRQTRRARFPDAAENERVLELQEGLAEYTGVVASTTNRAEAIAVAIAQLAREEWLSSLVRTFGYGSGTAYGVLLDTYSPGWTRRLEPKDDLGVLLSAATGLEPAQDAESAAVGYGGAALRAAEDARKAEKEAHVAKLRRQFVDGPVLVLPGTGSYSFASEGITPLGEHGSVYPTFRSTAEWGVLEAALALIASDPASVTVPAPVEVDGDTLCGDDWVLHLNPGWNVGPGPRPDDLVVSQEARGLEAQAERVPRILEQDSTLDNVIDPPRYETAEPGTLGDIMTAGERPVDTIPDTRIVMWHDQRDAVSAAIERFLSSVELAREPAGESGL